jgi:CelD/BcsL family acetyltransferase involved in cellulose biosynthesis
VELARVICTADLGNYEEAWRNRQTNSWSADPAASWEWIEAGGEMLSAKSKLLLLGSPSAPVGVLRLEKRVGIRLAIPLGSGLDRMAWCPGSTPSDAAAALDAGRRLASIWLPFTEENSIHHSLRVVARKHGQYLTIEGTDWAGYLASRPSSLRKTLRKATDRVQQHPSVTVQLLDDGETSSHMTQFADVEKHGHRRVGHLLSSPSGQQTFTAKVLSSLDRSGQVRTFAAFDRQGPCAYLIGVSAGRRFLAYTTATHERRSGLALGHLLLSESIQLAMAGGEAIDLGNGDTEFKRRWATSSRPLRDTFVGGAVQMFFVRRAVQMECAIRNMSHQRARISEGPRTRDHAGHQ